jgi:hypothetical protein
MRDEAVHQLAQAFADNVAGVWIAADDCSHHRWQAPEGGVICAAQGACPSAVGAASGRTGAYVATAGGSTFQLWPRRAGQTSFPANRHDRVYEPYGFHPAAEITRRGSDHSE